MITLAGFSSKTWRFWFMHLAGFSSGIRLFWMVYLIKFWTNLSSLSLVLSLLNIAFHLCYPNCKQKVSFVPFYTYFIVLYHCCISKTPIDNGNNWSNRQPYSLEGKSATPDTNAIIVWYQKVLYYKIWVYLILWVIFPERFLCFPFNVFI